MAVQKTTRSIKVGAGIAMHMIYSQAGTLGKAVLEFVMNSVDSGSSRVDITIDTNQVVVKDDGAGFDGREAIEKLFEVLCFEHGPKDFDHRIYGKYGLGRAQMWAFASTVWRTQAMRMTVDVKNRGLDYDLEDGLDTVKGCTITCSLYEPLTGGDVQRTIRDITDLSLYCPIPVYVNGEKVSNSVDDQKWDHVTDDAYIRLQRHGDLAIYNQGVLVCRYPGHRYGQGGEIVSRVDLDVNVARNDILVSKCKAWKRIEPFLKQEIAESTKKRKTLTDDERQRLVSDWAAGDLQWADVRDKAIIKLVTGRSVKPDNVFCRYSLPLTLADAKDRFTGDVIHRRKLASVLAPEMYSWFGLFDHGASHEKREKQLFEAIRSHLPEHIAKGLKDSPLATLSELVSDSHETIADKDLNKRDKAILGALRMVSQHLSAAARRAFGDEVAVQSRDIHLGESDAAYGWTDGSRYIVIERNHARQVQKGLGGIGQVVHTLMHEQCHEEVTTGDHDHDQSFYERYHDISCSQGDLARILLKGLISKFRQAGIPLNRNLMAAADLHQQSIGMSNDESLEAVQREPASKASNIAIAAQSRPIRKGSSRGQQRSRGDEAVSPQLTLAV